MNLNENKSIQIKGINEGILITMGEGNWGDLEKELLTILDEKANFFSGAKIALDVGSHVLRAADLGMLRDRFSDKGMTIWAVLGSSPSTEMNAQMLGMATRLSAPAPERKIHSISTDNIPGEEAIFIHRTLRSGFKVDYGGHVVVLGDVNPGAEINAGGSVVVWGRVRGSILAGMPENHTASVCALELTPTLLRIAGVTYIPLKRKGKNQPEMARVEDGQLVVESWKIKS
jgi:septum site-determining protein MinC